MNSLTINRRNFHFWCDSRSTYVRNADNPGLWGGLGGDGLGGLDEIGCTDVVVSSNERSWFTV